MKTSPLPPHLTPPPTHGGCGRPGGPSGSAPSPWLLTRGACALRPPDAPGTPGAAPSTNMAERAAASMRGYKAPRATRDALRGM